MASDSGITQSFGSLEEAFPTVDAGVEPLGHRVLVQLRTTKRKSSGGIVLVEDSRETEKWNTQVARIVSIGPIAWCNRDTGQPWAEGKWAGVGDFVRVPRWGGDRFEVPVEGQEEPALFLLANDHEIIAKITSDPLKMKSYIL